MNFENQNIFLFLHFLKSKMSFLGPLLVVWAFLVSYSRIYLGVHYPGDILGGALLGITLAWIVVYAYQKIISQSCFKKQC